NAPLRPYAWRHARLGWGIVHRNEGAEKDGMCVPLPCSCVALYNFSVCYPKNHEVFLSRLFHRWPSIFPSSCPIEVPVLMAKDAGRKGVIHRHIWQKASFSGKVAALAVRDGKG